MGKKASEISVLVLGGGVIGLTTALVLKLHGFKVRILTKHNLYDRSLPGFLNQYSESLSDRPVDLASIHAAASVIPHSVDHPRETDILEVSQKFFHRLAFSAGFGVRVQRHYELYENREKIPEYRWEVEGFKRLDLSGEAWAEDRNIPRRKNSKGVWGWYFDAFFVEVPTYLEALYTLYIKSEGLITIKEIANLEELEKEAEKENYDVVVNCSGRWTTRIFSSRTKTEIIRGHMIKVGINEVPRDKEGRYFSYNYSPDTDIYSRNQDDAGKQKTTKADVYFYPRSDGWLLGGSRQVGNPDFDKLPTDWRDTDEQIKGDTIRKKNWEVAVPRPMWDLNRELIRRITGIDIGDIEEDKYHSFAYIGYRFKSSPIRIEIGKDDAGKDEIKNRLLIHNYGHGGAGFTLSWGSAYEVLKLIKERFDPDIQIESGPKMSGHFYDSMKRILADLMDKLNK